MRNVGWVWFDQESGNTISTSLGDTFIEIEAGNLTVNTNSITADNVASNTLTGSEIQEASIIDVELADSSCNISYNC